MVSCVLLPPFCEAVAVALNACIGQQNVGLCFRIKDNMMVSVSSPLWATEPSYLITPWSGALGQQPVVHDDQPSRARMLVESVVKHAEPAGTLTIV